MVANRLRKNFKRLGKWARKNSVSCYRVDDADMPEYAVAFHGRRRLVQRDATLEHTGIGTCFRQCHRFTNDRPGRRAEAERVAY